MKLLSLLPITALLFWPIVGWAQALIHPNLTVIDTQVGLAFAKIKAAQAAIIAGQAEVKVGDAVTDPGWLRGTYQQGLVTPVTIPDGTVPVPFTSTRKPTDHLTGRDWDDLIVDPKPLDFARVQYQVDVYSGPQGEGFIMIARMQQIDCLMWHPGGEPCVWRYFVHEGPEQYRDNGEGVWQLQPLP